MSLLRFITNFGLSLLLSKANTFFTRAWMLRGQYDNNRIAYNDDIIVDENNEHIIIAAKATTDLYNMLLYCSHKHDIYVLLRDVVSVVGYPI